MFISLPNSDVELLTSDLMVRSWGLWGADNYGWIDISSAKVVPARGGGYMLKLPRAVPLD